MLMMMIGVVKKKTNEWIFEYPLHEDWFKYRFEPLWPDPE